jgi:hypothetical protein
MPRVVVFIGPSHPKAKECKLLDAEYRPPAKRGDLYKAAKEGAEIICLIDGVFFQDCSVAHKEILFALDCSVKVVGASSMGALRASELDIYGMEGVGDIYEAYRRKELVSDDEVALVFDPVSYEPMSEPLVNIRHNLMIAEMNGILSNEESKILLNAAMSRYFPERTYETMIDDCRKIIDVATLDRFKLFIDTSRVDLKMEDALKAINRVRQLAEGI